MGRLLRTLAAGGVVVFAAGSVAAETLQDRFVSYSRQVREPIAAIALVKQNTAPFNLPIVCEFSCIFPGACFKTLTLRPRVDLTPHFDNLLFRLDSLPRLMEGSGHRILSDTALPLDHIDKAAAALRGEGTDQGFEHRVRAALEDAKTYSRRAKFNALSAAESLDLLLADAVSLQQRMVTDTRATLNGAKAQIKADERCYKGEEEQMELFMGLIQPVTMQVSLHMANVTRPAAAWSDTLRRLAGVAGNAENQIQGVQDNAVTPGFAGKVWTRIAAATAVDDLAGSVGLAGFWSQPCADLSWCR